MTDYLDDILQMASGTFDGLDAWLDALCDTLGLSLWQIVRAIAKLPDDNVNKRELLRQVYRMRKAARAKNMDAVEGWHCALATGLKSASFLIPLATAKRKSESALTKEVRQSGTKALKAKAATRQSGLHKDIDDYLNKPDALIKGSDACLLFLKGRNLTYGYADSTVEREIKKLFAIKRLALNAKK